MKELKFFPHWSDSSFPTPCDPNGLTLKYCTKPAKGNDYKLFNVTAIQNMTFLKFYASLR